jgi:hypothetical protein
LAFFGALAVSTFLAEQLLHATHEHFLTTITTSRLPAFMWIPSRARDVMNRKNDKVSDYDNGEL